MNAGDISTDCVMPNACVGRAQLLCKQDGIIAGLDVFARVFEVLDSDVRFEACVSDGDAVCKGQLLGVVRGDVRAILSGERTALNYLQRMSGIATYTNKVAKLLEGSATTLVDTRKTTPGMRLFEKEAARLGGAVNHRYNLTDGVMLKDNHIAAAGGITKAVACARARAPFVRKIEVETETLEQVQEALDAGADIIMLDNMDRETMAAAVALHRRPRPDRMFGQYHFGKCRIYSLLGRRFRLMRGLDPFRRHSRFEPEESDGRWRFG